MNFKMTRMLSRGIVFMFLAILLFLALVLIVNKFTDGDTSQLVTTIVTGFVAALTFASRDFFDADDKGDNGTVATVPAEIIPPDNTGPAGRFGDANGFLGSSKSDNNFANRWDDRGDRYPNDDGYGNTGFNNAGFNNAGFNNAGFNNAGFNNAGFNNSGGGSYIPPITKTGFAEWDQSNCYRDDCPRDDRQGRPDLDFPNQQSWTNTRQ